VKTLASCDKSRLDPAHIYELDNSECAWQDCRTQAESLFGEKPTFCARHLMKARKRLEMTVHLPAAITRAEVPRPDVKSDGVVYFMLKGDRVKIGFTTDLAQRAKDLKVERVIGFFPGTMHDERTTHDAFADWRMDGEWFAATPVLLAKIEQLLTPPRP